MKGAAPPLTALLSLLVLVSTTPAAAATGTGSREGVQVFRGGSAATIPLKTRPRPAKTGQAQARSTSESARGTPRPSASPPPPVQVAALQPPAAPDGAESANLVALQGTGRPPARGAKAPEPTAETVCLEAIRREERRHRLPLRMLMAIGLTETGRSINGRLTIWPWSVNAAGKGRYFATKAEALAHVRDLRAKGVRSIDVGCMQVNLHFHPDAFPDLETALDPGANVAYAARFLKGLNSDLRSWSKAVRRYHSATPKFADVYFERVAENLRLLGRRRHDLADTAALRERLDASRAQRAAAREGKAKESVVRWRLPKSAGEVAD